MPEHKSLIRCVVVTLLCLSVFSSSLAFAQSPVRSAGHLGLGASIDVFHAGISGKYYMDESTALQAFIGSKIDEPGYKGSWLALGADYLFELHTFGQKEIDLGWFVGPGARISVSSREYWEIGLMGVIGGSILFNKIPLDFTVVYSPSITFGDYSRFRSSRFLSKPANFGVRIRYFFKL